MERKCDPAYGGSNSVQPVTVEPAKDMSIENRGDTCKAKNSLDAIRHLPRQKYIGVRRQILIEMLERSHEILRLQESRLLLEQSGLLLEEISVDPLDDPM